MGMRKSANFLIPLTLITLYYAFWFGGIVLLLAKMPAARDFFPIGGFANLGGTAAYIGRANSCRG